jgi:glyoxylase-like metal-dependent hydrolase (beta-lactamase superfamily II)
LTDEERKEPFRWYGENFIFFAQCADLSKGVEIYRNVDISYPDYHVKTFECALIRDCMMFGIWWRDNVHKYLNGFSGFDTVRVEIDPSLNMKIDVLKVGYLETNCYILRKDKETIIIDPGDQYEDIVNIIGNSTLVGILVTHYHDDHIGALKRLEDHYGIKANAYHNSNITVIDVPGHTNDSKIFYFKNEGIMFVGDFIFKGSIGRCDLPTGDSKEMQKSIEMIKNYPDDIVIYNGHGDKTTLKEEKKTNPYF